MAALDRDRSTPEKKAEVFDIPPAAGAVLFRGALGAIDAAGLAVPAAAIATLRIVGRVEQGSADAASPTPGVVTAGAPARIRMRRGCYAFDNSAAADAIGDADWGRPVYAVDDHTLAKTDGGGTRPLAGICRGVDAAGVWVEL